MQPNTQRVNSGLLIVEAMQAGRPFTWVEWQAVNVSAGEWVRGNQQRVRAFPGAPYGW